MEKQVKNMATTNSQQVLGYSYTNDTPFIIVPSEQVAFMQGQISINDSRPAATEHIVKKHLDKYEQVWQALA
jgi:hypothetical protein